jgi:parallel beta-helix repeat protein
MTTTRANLTLLNLFFLFFILASALSAQVETKLVPADGDSTDLFGRSNDVSFYYAIAGAPQDDNDNGQDAGAAYIYRNNDTGWDFLQKITATDGAAEDNFGYSVAVSQNYIVVGAPWDGDAGEKSGAAYIYKRVGEEWVEDVKLTAEDAGEDNRFGISVAITEDGWHAAVGAFFDDDFGARTGSVYIFTRTGDNTWVQKQKLLPDDAAEGDWFGVSIDIDQHYLAVGSRYDDNENGADAGGVYIFKRIENVWTQQQKIIADDGQEGDLFHKVALHNHNLVVGAFRDDDKGVNSGSAYVFKRSGEEWTQERKILPPVEADVEGDNFGASVDIYGNRIIISAYRNDVWGQDAGIAYLYRHDGATWDLERVVVPMDINEGDWFGLPASIYRSTLFISSRQDDDHGANSGSVYSFYHYTKIFTVSEDGPITISQAMSACDYGDRILVEPGVYNETVVMQTGAILRSNEGPDKTTLIAGGADVIVATAPGSYVDGFTIAGSNDEPAVRGVTFISNYAELKNCIIRNCVTGIHATYFSSGSIENNDIDNNTEHGIFLDQNYGLYIYNNILTNNGSGIFFDETLSDNIPSINYNCYFNNGVDYGYVAEPWTPYITDGELFQDPMYVGGEPFDYRLRADSPCIDGGDPSSGTDPDGSHADMGALIYTPETIVADEMVTPADYALYAASPNPFNPSTTLRFQTAHLCHVTLTVYNLLGERVAALFDQPLQAGEHSVVWNGRDEDGHSAASGLYFYRVESRPVDGENPAFIDTGKMLLTK